MKINMSSDRVFYSIQCEGSTVGHPAVFFRVAGCTLDCKWCDTAAVWKNSTPMTFEEIWELMKPYLSYLDAGAHLILTGGSPLRQQNAIASFLYWVREHHDAAQRWYIECETEGVLAPESLQTLVAQWNVSPKLSNSGMAFERRFKIDVLRIHSSVGHSIFKFPVDVLDKVQEQLDEIEAIIAMARIHRPNVWLMPVCDTRETHRVALPLAIEIAKNYGFCVSPRLHLEIWDKTTGV